MRVCLLSRNDHVSDPRARALRASLESAGHEVHVVASGPRPSGAPEPSTYVPTRTPVGRGPLGRALRTAQPRSVRRHRYHTALVKAVRAVRAQVIYPTSAKLVELAAAAAEDDAAVVGDPAWPDAGPRDLVVRAPIDPDAAPPAAGPGEPFHTPHDHRDGWTPEPGRLRGQRIALAYRKTASNPGRYLEDALGRAGAEVLLFTEKVDLDALPDDVRAVVFVESPYPALEVTGTSSVPILFWVHHGEHHLAANLRLAHRYRADAVLLAHSWHLAHRFHVPVHRFPFGIDTALFDASAPWSSRPFDVAMVGAHLRGGGPYQRRQELVRLAEEGLPEGSTAFLEGVTPEKMAATYGQARTVLNEGGVRHHPITMRVFEAVSAGALLLTDPIPGLGLLFTPDEHFHHLDDDVVAQIQRVVADPASAGVAAAALEHARQRHTYDHRVDELLQIVGATTAESSPAPPGPSGAGLAAAVHRDVEVQRLLVADATDLADALPDREVWELERVRDRIRPGTYEALAMELDDVADVDEAVLLAARRYLYLDGAARGLRGFLEQHHPDATIRRVDGVNRVDLGVDSYTVRREQAVDA